MIAGPSNEVPKRAVYQPEFTDDTVMAIPRNIVEKMKEDYDINNHEMILSDWRWAPNQNRIYIPIRDKDNTRIGCVLRSLDKAVQPKSKIFLFTSHKPLADFHINIGKLEYKDVCLIVEDQFSKVRAERYAKAAVALLGTNMNVSKASAIAAVCAKERLRPVWALDADAFDKSLKFQQEYNTLLPGSAVIKLDKDIKNMSDEAVRRLILEI